MGKDRPGEPVAQSGRLSGEPARSGGPGAAPRRALYGRSHGRKLRPHHARLIGELLPRLEIGDAPIGECAGLFPFVPSEVRLEIGFGGGEHLLAQAAARPDVGFIGCEPFVNGLAKALAGIEAAGLENIRLRAGDAAALLAALPDAALSRVFILYPDPWPKRRHNKRRLVSLHLVHALARVMRPGAELRFATDIDDYAGWTLRRFLDCRDFVWRAAEAEDWRRPWPEWRPTRYEAKAARAGRTPVYLTFERR